MKQGITESVFEICKPITDKLGLSIYDIEYVKEGPDYYLRIFIDKKGGVGINDCENVSHELDPLLDKADIIKESYYLEVSSVGLDRPLKTEKDFNRFMGEKIEIKLYKPIGKKRELVGKLIEYNNGDFSILTDDNQKIQLNIKDTGLIRPWIEF